MKKIGAKDINGIELFDGDKVLPFGFNKKVFYGIIFWNKKRLGWDIAINGDFSRTVSESNEGKLYIDDFNRCTKL